MDGGEVVIFGSAQNFATAVEEKIDELGRTDFLRAQV